jgi:peroxisomal 3,2-trans-enoyl-CoA isomerase
MATHHHLLVEQHDGGVRLLTLNRPRHANALNDTLYLALVEALEAADRDPAVTAVVLTGAGSHFCSGQDLTDVDVAQRTRVPSLALPVGRFMLAVLNFSKLLAAAVNGPAVGIGATLLAHCDLVVATAAAHIWTPFARLGVVPEFGSSITFPKRLGETAATRLLLLQEALSAEECVQCQLYSQVVLPEESVARVTVARLQHAAARDARQGKSWPAFRHMLRQRSHPAVVAAVHQELAVIDARFRSDAGVQDLIAAALHQKQQPVRFDSKL